MRSAGVGDLGEDLLTGAHEGGGIRLGQEEAFDEVGGDGEAGVIDESAVKLGFPVVAGGEEEAVGGEVGGEVFAVEGEGEGLKVGDDDEDGLAGLELLGDDGDLGGVGGGEEADGAAGLGATEEALGEVAGDGAVGDPVAGGVEGGE